MSLPRYGVSYELALFLTSTTVDPFVVKEIIKAASVGSTVTLRYDNNGTATVLQTDNADSVGNLTKLTDHPESGYEISLTSSQTSFLCKLFKPMNLQKGIWGLQDKTRILLFRHITKQFDCVLEEDLDIEMEMEERISEKRALFEKETSFPWEKIGCYRGYAASEISLFSGHHFALMDLWKNLPFPKEGANTFEKAFLDSCQEHLPSIGEKLTGVQSSDTNEIRLTSREAEVILHVYLAVCLALNNTEKRLTKARIDIDLKDHCRQEEYKKMVSLLQTQLSELPKCTAMLSQLQDELSKLPKSKNFLLLEEYKESGEAGEAEESEEAEPAKKDTEPWNYRILRTAMNDVLSEIRDRDKKIDKLSKSLQKKDEALKRKSEQARQQAEYASKTHDEKLSKRVTEIAQKDAEINRIQKACDVKTSELEEKIARLREDLKKKKTADEMAVQVEERVKEMEERIKEKDEIIERRDNKIADFRKEAKAKFAEQEAELKKLTDEVANLNAKQNSLNSDLSKMTADRNDRRNSSSVNRSNWRLSVTEKKTLESEKQALEDELKAERKRSKPSV